MAVERRLSERRKIIRRVIRFFILLISVSLWRRERDLWMKPRTLDGWGNEVLPETVQHQKNLQYLSTNVRPSWRWDYRGISRREEKRLKIKHRGPKATATASFRLLTALSLLLIIAGDVELNPGPLFAGTHLGPDDLRDVLEQVWDFSRKWYDIGLELRLSNDALKNIRQQHSDQHDALREMLSIWLDGMGSPPTWSTLTDALESRIVGANLLAAKLRTTYCYSQHVLDTLPYQDGGASVSPPPILGAPLKDTNLEDTSSLERTEPSGTSSDPEASGCVKSGDEGLSHDFAHSQLQVSRRSTEHSTERMNALPLLDVENLKEWEKDSLKGRLLEESEKMMFTFQNLVTNTSESLTQRGVTPSHLLKHLYTMGGLEPAVERAEKTPFDDRLKELKKADSIDECFFIIRDYLSFFNYHTIEHIIEKLGAEEDRSELESYKEKLADYCKRRVFECPPKVFGLPSKSDHDLAIVKLDKNLEKYTLEQLQRFQSNLSSIIGIARYTLRLISVERGCMKLTFVIPSIMMELVFPLSADQERALQAEGVLWLKCGPYQFPMDEFIKELTECIGRKWKALARVVHFSQTDIDSIERAHYNDLREEINDFFCRWKQREGREASITKIVEGLRAAKLMEELKHMEEAGLVPTASQARDTNPMKPPFSSSTGGTPVDPEFVRQMRLKRFSSSSDATPPQVSRTTSMASTGSATSNDRDLDSKTKGLDLDSVQSPTLKKDRPFEVDDLVKWEQPDCTYYGVIKWIGPLLDKQVAGIEIEEKTPGGCSGEFQGVRHFDCQKGHGIFLPLDMLKRDDRFDSIKSADLAIQELNLSGEDAEKDMTRLPSAVQTNNTGTPSKLHPSQSQSLEAIPLEVSPTSKNRSHSLENIPVLVAATALKELLSGSASVSEPPSSDDMILVFRFPGDQAGLIIGKEGRNIRDVRDKTNTRIKVDKKDQHNLGTNGKAVIFGKEENCKKALCMILEDVRRKIARQIATSESIPIPSRLCGRVIGKEGSTCNAIERLSGARLKIEQKDGLEGLFDQTRTCKITGSPEQIEEAKEFIQMAMDGEDIVKMATLAAVIVVLMKEFKNMGFEFDPCRPFRL